MPRPTRFKTWTPTDQAPPRVPAYDRWPYVMSVRLNYICALAGIIGMLVALTIAGVLF